MGELFVKYFDKNRLYSAYVMHVIVVTIEPFEIVSLTYRKLGLLRQRHTHEAENR